MIKLSDTLGCLAYIDNRYKENDEYVIIGEIETSNKNGYYGTTYLCTALVPNDDLTELLESNKECSYKIENWGPRPIIDEGSSYKNFPYIRGLNNKSYEPLVNSWEDHNKITFVPMSNLLMTYGLSVNITKEKIFWDDLSNPVFQVIENIPTSDYHYENIKGSLHTRAFVKIRRDYLEDYASLKNSSVVAFYYEERFLINGNEQINEILKGSEAREIKISSNRISLSVSSQDKYRYYISVWGRQLVLTPTHSPISDPVKEALVWCDIEEPVHTDNYPSLGFKSIFVKADYLKEFENKEEYSVYPESGSVNYDNRWSISHTKRVSRNIVEMELKKLYEGNPEYIITKIHKYSVDEETFKRDLATYGVKNIGSRAKSYIYSFFKLIKSIVDLCDKLCLDFDFEDLCGLKLDEIEYNGWYTFSDLKILSNTVDIACCENEFQNRAKLLFKLVEKISEKNLRKILLQIGFDTKEKLKSLGSLTLLSRLLQLVEIAYDKGLNLKEDISNIKEYFKDDYNNGSLGYFFALNDIRIIESHNTGKKLIDKYNNALEYFGIDKDENRLGWGPSVDALYDRMEKSFIELSKIFNDYTIDS